MTNIEKIQKITDEYGQLHEEGCEINDEGGSFDGCDCAMKSLSEEVAQLLTQQLNTKKEMKKNEFECAKCGGVFEKARSDEEAKKEAEGFFGKNPNDWNDEVVVVCDDCFNEIHPLKNPEAVKRARQII